MHTAARQHYCAVCNTKSSLRVLQKAVAPKTCSAVWCAATACNHHTVHLQPTLRSACGVLIVMLHESWYSVCQPACLRTTRRCGVLATAQHDLSPDGFREIIRIMPAHDVIEMFLHGITVCNLRLQLVSATGQGGCGNAGLTSCKVNKTCS
jgi:hypothetical protein